MPRVEPAADVTVADFMRAWPQTAQVFLHRGMACVGCDLSIFETLADAAGAYGVDLDRFLMELAEAMDGTAEPDDPEKETQ